nr:hypothetical protein [Xanthomonas phaseoli]
MNGLRKYVRWQSWTAASGWQKFTPKQLHRRLKKLYGDQCWTG